MLIIKISVNWDEIEDILIHNTGEFDDERNTIYELMNPENPDKKLIPDTILHRKDDGYRKLLIKALELLEFKKMKTKTLNKD